MSLEANSFLLFPYSQRLAASKFSLADLHSHCAARLVVPSSLPISSSTPHLNGVISEDVENVDSGASRSRRYSIVSCSNDLEYISRFNQQVMKVSLSLYQNILACYDSHSLCSSSLLPISLLCLSRVFSLGTIPHTRAPSGVCVFGGGVLQSLHVEGSQCKGLPCCL